MQAAYKIEFDEQVMHPVLAIDLATINEKQHEHLEKAGFLQSDYFALQCADALPIKNCIEEAHVHIRHKWEKVYGTSAL